jgi:predicted GNAT family N-acyltransferase
MSLMDVVEFGPLNETKRRELEGDELDPFDAAGTPLHWRPKERHVALREADGNLVASAGLVLAEVQVGEAAPMSVVGIGGVIVAARYRGQGLGQRIIVEALDRAATMGPTVAMLFCHRDRAGLYARQGFQEIAEPVLVEQPDGWAEMPMVSMWRTLHEGASLPPGPITVHGLPF